MVGTAAAALCVAVATTFFFRSVLADERAIAACGRDATESEQFDCWLDIMREKMREEGVSAAMRVFARVYDQYPAFAQSGCHTHAHRVGDMAYYEHYLGDPDFDSMEFPQETTSCGYGFYHGFFEHLVQDTPDPHFITETCTYFHERLGETMRDIRQICYHGSGHGLILARSEHVPRKEWGNAHAFVAQPLAACEQLAEAEPREVEECQEGVYNVLVEWMETEDYGFEYSDSAPFAVCDTERSLAHRRACYYEMAMKLDRVSEWNIGHLAELVRPIRNDALRDMAFIVGVAGMMQRYAGTEEYVRFMAQCAELENELTGMCVKAIIAGLFEHGPPQEEYRAALAACRLESVASSTSEEPCWRAVANRLPRFYQKERVEGICTEFPDAFQELCSA